MAVLPLNTFRTITRPLTNTVQTLYTCPTGVTGIVLMAQVSNVGSGNTGKVTFSHVRQRTVTELVKNCPVPTEDARSVLTGRLVLEEGDRITVIADVSNVLKIVMSVVESANT
jgi:hypothetical protein